MGAAPPPPIPPPGTAIPLDVARLRDRLGDPATEAVRQRVYDLFTEPVFDLHYGEPTASERARTRARWDRLVEAGCFVGCLTAHLPGAPAGAPAASRARHDAVMEAVAYLDHSLEVAIGVHVGLFGGTIALLGSAAQAAKWLPPVEAHTMRGCFALTELGHGSNARGIETTAVWDGAADGFVLHTPRETAQKYWVGGAAETARWATVFAQLTVGGDTVGVHPFVVRIRADDGSPVPGVTTADCGVKGGLNGVDNGRIWFDHVLVPRGHMLSGENAVSAAGVYTSRHSTPDARFASQLAALTGGRVGISRLVNNQAKLGLTIAVRYALSRRAFSPTPGAPEARLLDYASHRRRLMLPLATTVVYSLAAGALKDEWNSHAELRDAAGRRLGVTKRLHVLSAGAKALCSWHARDALQECREACGGQGYKSDNRIAAVRATHDISCTFEGDNLVLMHTVAKALLGDYAAVVGARRRGGGKLPPFGELLAFLNTPRMGAAPLPSPRVSPRDVDAPTFVTAVLRDHAAASMTALATAYAAAIKAGTAFDAWNSVATAAADTAAAVMAVHAHAVGAAAVAAAATADARARRSGVAEPLALAVHLHSLGVVAASPGYLRSGALRLDEAAAVEAAIERGCTALAELSRGVVDAFGIPERLLAPIAGDWVAHNSRARL